MKKKEDIERIYGAALSAFSRHGYRKTTLEDVAGRLDMAPSNLYLYVKNKRDLYQNTVIFALLRWQGRVARDMEGVDSPEEKFLTMCRSAVFYLEEDEDLRRLLILDPDIFPMFADKDPFEHVNRASVALLTDMIREGVAAGRFRKVDPEVTAEAIFSVYKMLIIRSYIKLEKKAGLTLFEQILDLITSGLFIGKGPG